MRTGTIIRSRQRLRSSEQGATAVEAAIIFTALMLLIFGILQFAQIFWAWNTMLLAIEEGGRYAMVYNPTNFPPSGGGPGCNDTLANCAVAQANAVLAAYPSPSVAVSCFSGCAGNSPTMTLQGTFTFDFLFPTLFPYGPITLTNQYTVPLS